MRSVATGKTLIAVATREPITGTDVISPTMQKPVALAHHDM